VDLEVSLALNRRQFLPRDIEEMTCATGSWGKYAYTALSHDVRRWYVRRAIERGIAPRAIANMMKAVRETTQGATTYTGAPVYYGDEQLRLKGIEPLVRFLSFNPSEFSMAKEKQWKERQLEEKYKDERSIVYSKVRKWVRGGMSRDGWANLMNDIEEYNVKVRNLKRYDSVPYITPASIKSTITRMSRPNRRERVRAGQVERGDVPDFSGLELSGDRSAGPFNVVGPVRPLS